MLTSSADGTARIWDAKYGTELVTLEGHTDWVWQATWSRDETRVLTGRADGTARVWYDRMADLIKATCRQARRNMTWDEWNRFMDGPYRPTCDAAPGGTGTPVPPDVVQALTTQGLELIQAGEVVTGGTRLAKILALPPVTASDLEAAAREHLAQALSAKGHD